MKACLQWINSSVPEKINFYTLWHILWCLGTWYSNKIAPSIRQLFFQSPDDLGHHEAVEALVLEILLEPIDGTLHCYWCAVNVVHLSLLPACWTRASIFSQPLIYFGYSQCFWLFTGCDYLIYHIESWTFLPLLCHLFWCYMFKNRDSI